MTVNHRPVSLPEPGLGLTIPRFLVAGLATVSAAAVLTVPAVSSASVDEQIRWGSVALGTFCIGLLLLMSAVAGHEGLGLASWRFGSWSLLWAALAFGLATVTWIGPQTGEPAEILPESMLRALWMIAVAMTMLTAGYCSGLHRLATARTLRFAGALGRRFTDEVRSPVRAWALFAVGVVAQVAYAVSSGHFGFIGNVAASETTASSYGQVLAILGECAPLAVLTAAIRARQTRTLSDRLTMAVLFLAAIAIGAVSGGKTSFVVAVIAVILPYSLGRRRLPVGLITAAMVFFLLIVIPFNESYRVGALGGTSLSTSQAIATAPTVAGRVLAGDLSLATIADSFDYLGERIRSTDSAAIIMQRTPSEIPYRNPAELLADPVIDLVPRALWPGKPILSVGYQMSQEYYQLPPSVYTSSDITPEGDLYRHGGWFWLLAGMFLGGVGLRTLDESIDLRRSVHGGFLMLLLFPDIVMAGTDCATLLAGIPGMVLLWLCVVATCFQRRTATTRKPELRPVS